jgi:ribonuclease HII
MKDFHTENIIEVGIDEAGRGSILGDVYAAAVIWNNKKDNNKIRDSKKMTRNQRKEVREWIECNLKYGVGSASREEIDKMNILRASHLAMHRAINNLRLNNRDIIIDHIIVDGNMFKKYEDTQYTTVINGDNLYYSIACASILAKENHDDHIKELIKTNQDLKIYDLENNMGYGTKKHLEQIGINGISKYHRRTYKCCKNK